MISNATLRVILEKSKIIGKEQISKLFQEAEAAKISLEEFLFKNKLLTEESLYKTAGEVLNMPLVDLSELSLRKDILFLIPESIALSHKIIAFDQKDQEISLATLDPDDVQIFDFIGRKTGFTPKIYLALPQQFEEAIKQYRQSLKTEFEKLGQAMTSTEAAE